MWYSIICYFIQLVTTCVINIHGLYAFIVQLSAVFVIVCCVVLSLCYYMAYIPYRTFFRRPYLPQALSSAGPNYHHISLVAELFNLSCSQIFQFWLYPAFWSVLLLERVHNHDNGTKNTFLVENRWNSTEKCSILAGNTCFWVTLYPGPFPPTLSSDARP